MSNRFASGKYSIAECDRCGQRYKLKELRKLTIKTVEATMREFDDLQALSANSKHGEAIRMCKVLLTIAKEWN
jgi:PHP family Zn ribbon phosphoesterase